MQAEGNAEAATIFDFDSAKFRQSRYEYAMTQIPRIIARNLPMRRIIPMIHRLGIAQDILGG